MTELANRSTSQPIPVLKTAKKRETTNEKERMDMVYLQTSAIVGEKIAWDGMK